MNEKKILRGINFLSMVKNLECRSGEQLFVKCDGPKRPELAMGELCIPGTEGQNPAPLAMAKPL